MVNIRIVLTHVPIVQKLCQRMTNGRSLLVENTTYGTS